MQSVQEEIARLLLILKTGGDPRLGGTLPLGGKAYAGGVSPESRFITAIDPAEAAGHDASMNFHEAMLEDLLRRQGAIK